MCGSMADIQSPTAEIRRGNKKEEEETTALKYIWPALLYRAAINNNIYYNNIYLLSCLVKLVKIYSFNSFFQYYQLF